MVIGALVCHCSVLVIFLVINANSRFCNFAEIEAQEACKWLRAAGFPQYAQMYEGE